MYNKEYYYSEDDIITVDTNLKSLINAPLIDENREIFTVVDYNIKAANVKQSTFNWFKKPTEVTKFYIDNIKFKFSDGQILTHKENEFCTLSGVIQLLNYKKNFTKLEHNLVSYCKNNNVNFAYGKFEGK